MSADATSTVLVEVPKPLADARERCRRLRDEGIDLAESGDWTDYSKNLIDQAVAFCAAQGRPFSANDVRALIGDLDIPGPLYGARFMAARKAGLIRPQGYVGSTLPSTHAHPIRQWIGIPKAVG